MHMIGHQWKYVREFCDMIIVLLHYIVMYVNLVIT